MTAWPMVPLGEVLLPTSRPEQVVATEQYRLLGAHWYAEGLYVKDIKAGSEIQANQLYKVEAGDFVYNRLFAWKGSFALAGKDVHGCYVSNEFPCFRLREDRVDGRFLHYYFSRESVWNETLGLSSGGTPTSRNRLKEDHLLAMSMPLPPLDEQRRIAKKIAHVYERLKQADSIAYQVKEGLAVLLGQLTHKLFGPANAVVGDIAAVTKLAGFEYTKYFTHALPGPVVAVRAGNVRDTGLELDNAMTISEEVSNALPRSQLKAGDLAMTFIGAGIGAVTYIQNGMPRLHCGPNVAKITPVEAVDCRYLVRVLQSRVVQRQIEEITKSTAQPSLSMKTIRQLQVPIPDLDAQRVVLEAYQGLQDTTQAMFQNRIESDALRVACQKSLLNQAFSGQL